MSGDVFMCSITIHYLSKVQIYWQMKQEQEIIEEWWASFVHQYYDALEMLREDDVFMFSNNPFVLK